MAMMEFQVLKTLTDTTIISKYRFFSRLKNHSLCTLKCFKITEGDLKIFLLWLILYDLISFFSISLIDMEEVENKVTFWPYK